MCLISITKKRNLGLVSILNNDDSNRCCYLVWLSLSHEFSCQSTFKKSRKRENIPYLLFFCQPLSVPCASSHVTTLSCEWWWAPCLFYRVYRAGCDRCWMYTHRLFFCHLPYTFIKTTVKIIVKCLAFPFVCLSRFIVNKLRQSKKKREELTKDATKGG